MVAGGRVRGDALRRAGGGGHAAAQRGVAAPRRPAAAEDARARARRQPHHRHAAPPGLRHLPVRRVQRGTPPTMLYDDPKEPTCLSNIQSHSVMEKFYKKNVHKIIIILIKDINILKSFLPLCIVSNNKRRQEGLYKQTIVISIFLSTANCYQQL